MARVAAQPALEYRRVDGAEVDVELEVAVIEIGQRRVRPIDAALDFAAERKHRHRRAVVGPVRSVLLDAPAEFRERQRERAVGVSVRGEILIERA